MHKIVLSSLTIFWLFINSFGTYAQEIVVVDKHARWEYHDQDTFPGIGWNQAPINNQWKKGKTLIGYGNTDQLTTIRNQIITCYFRKKINIKDTSGIKFYGINLTYDDGIIFYVNGKEVFSRNLPDEEVNTNTHAITKVQPGDPFYIRIEKDGLNMGENIIAAEVHNYNPSSDLTFGVEMYASLPGENMLITKGDLWNYIDIPMPENKHWISELDQNLNWKTGYAKFGYGEGDEATVIQYGDDEYAKNITTYFRKDIVISDPAKYMAYLLNLKVDDGAVIYLNGDELWRVNMPKGTITDSTKALFRITNENENKIYTHVVDAELLSTGLNTISVSVHQRSASTSDCSFEMEFAGVEDVGIIHQILSRDNAEIDEKLIALRDQMDIRSKELEIRLKDQELQLRQLYINVILVVIIVLIVGSLIFWYYLRNQKKAIAENNTSLKNELVTKNQEVMNLSLGLLNKNRLIDDLESDVEDSERRGDPQHLISRIKRKLSSQISKDQEWENLQLHFENVQSDFFTNLKRDFPILNSNELRLCGYIRLQLTTKEIARMLSVDPRSVQTSRYRLKKKMGLQQDNDLIQFLITYA